MEKKHISGLESTQYIKFPMVFMFKLPGWFGKLKWKHTDPRKQRTTEEQGRKPCSVVLLKCGTDIRIHKIDQWYRMETRWMHQITYLIWGHTEDQWGENGLFL